MSRDKILAANPIETFLLNRGAVLKRSGDNYKTNVCPIAMHRPHHRPVTVDPRKNLWHCNDCGKGGSSIDWLMYQKNCTAAQAMQLLNGSAAPLPRTKPPPSPPSPKSKSGARPRLVAFYDYVDETGALLYQVCRFVPKDFKQRRPDGKGGWIWNMEGVRHVLYQLPQVVATKNVIVVEGEKDSNALAGIDIDIVATCNSGGALKWRPEHSEMLRGKDVIVIGDNDDNGRRHVEQVVASLTGIARSIKRVTLPDGFHDVSDYIASLPPESAAKTISTLIETTPVLKTDDDDLPEPVSLMTLAETPPDPALTLLGDRFLCLYGGMLFIGPSGIGKSSASVQQDILWALGLPAFGIRPARPLRILCIQGENDDGDLHEMAKGICDRLELTAEERELVRKNVLYVSDCSHTGVSFLVMLGKLLEKYGPFDIVRIDTLMAYLGGDILDPEVTARFLRNGLNPILKKFGCAAIINHHTPKTTYRDTSEWKASDWMYSGAGNHDITNWARGALVINPTHAPDVFEFHAAKRGKRLAWVDEEGMRTYRRLFCWDKGDSIYWREADAEDAERVESRKPKAKGRTQKTKLDLLALVPPEGSVPKNVLLQWAKTRHGIGLNTARAFLAELIGDGELFEWHIPRPRTNPEVRISRHEQHLI